MLIIVCDVAVTGFVNGDSGSSNISKLIMIMLVCNDHPEKYSKQLASYGIV